MSARCRWRPVRVRRDGCLEEDFNSILSVKKKKKSAATAESFQTLSLLISVLYLNVSKNVSAHILHFCG